MIKGIDHVVILVKDLAEATADYTGLGFTVLPGGEHVDGASHNALIAFADGSYIELLAFKKEAPGHRWWPKATNEARGGEGLIDFALLPTEIENDISAARERGLAYQGPVPGGRLRPDGQAVWLSNSVSLTLDHAWRRRYGDDGIERIDTDAVTVDWRILDLALVERCHARGLAVLAWTVDDLPLMRQLLAMGVDGLTSNRPDRFAQVELPPPERR